MLSNYFLCPLPPKPHPTVEGGECNESGNTPYADRGTKGLQRLNLTLVAVRGISVRVACRLGYYPGRPSTTNFSHFGTPGAFKFTLVAARGTLERYRRLQFYRGRRPGYFAVWVITSEGLQRLNFGTLVPAFLKTTPYSTEGARGIAPPEVHPPQWGGRRHETF